MPDQTNEACKKFVIFKLLNILFTFLIYVATKIGPFIVLVLIALFSIINLLSVLITIFGDTLNIDDDTIIQDTLKYRMLKYVDYVQSILEGKNETEPIFNIFIIKQFISAVIYMYFGAVFTLILMFIIIGILAIAPLFKSDLVTDTENLSEQKIKSLFTADIFFGLIAAIFLQLLHKLFYSSYIHQRLLNIKEGYNNLDYYILSTLNTQYSEYFPSTTNDGKEVPNTEKIKFFKGLYETVESYKKDNKNDVVSKIVDLCKSDENIDNNKLKLGFLTFVLYSHLYDNIPDTNTSAQKSVVKYFFKKINSSTTDVSNVLETGDTELSFAAFFLEKEGIQFIDKTKYTNLLENTNTIYELDDIIDTINYKLREIPDFGNLSTEILAFSSILCAVSVTFAIVHYKLLQYFSTDNDKEKLNQLKSFISSKKDLFTQSFKERKNE